MRSILDCVVNISGYLKELFSILKMNMIRMKKFNFGLELEKYYKIFRNFDNIILGYGNVLILRLYI